MLRIRRFEEAILEAFPRGLIFGTTHTYIGQEANAVGVLSQRQNEDIVISNHRCHGHFLASGGSMSALAAEMMGRSTGVCAGRGGSQHLHWDNFFSSGILGGTLPLAVGMAFAQKAQQSGQIVFAFTGDGALGEGVVYESLNMASLWTCPVLFVLENNRYAQTTPVEVNLAGGIGERFRSFGIPTDEQDTTDVAKIEACARSAVDHVRNGKGPYALIIHTYRFAPHSRGDDMRDPAEIERFRQRDPLKIQATSLKKSVLAQLDVEVRTEVEDAFNQAETASMADPASLTYPIDLIR
jgi:2-oxoisovalerate dehydrogenase E1 component